MTERMIRRMRGIFWARHGNDTEEEFAAARRRIQVVAKVARDFSKRLTNG